jgi:von Willebrand factor type A domain
MRALSIHLMCLAWIMGMIPLIGDVPQACAQGMNDKALKKLLISRKELVRLQGVGVLESNPRLKYEYLDLIIESADHHLKLLDEDESPSPSGVALLYAIGSTDRPAANEFLIRHLDSPNQELVLLVADILGTNQCETAIEKISNLTSHASFVTSYAFRFNVIRSLWNMKDPKALEMLCKIHANLDGQLRADLDRMMKEVDVSMFHGDEAAFANWQSEQKQKTVIQNASYSSQDKVLFGKSQYYGIDIESKRILFILDHSDSMREPTAGYTRLDRAKQELIAAIRGLVPETEFSIMIFSNKTRFWRSELVRADEESKLKAIAFVNGIGYGDRTNTHAALLDSLKFDESLESVYLLSDGRPTAGDIVKPLQIVSEVMHRNRFRHLRFHTIGVSVSGETRAFLEALASQSNGEFRQVN